MRATTGGWAKRRAPPAYDWAGYNDLVEQSGVGHGAAGAINGDSEHRVDLRRIDQRLRRRRPASTPGPNTFTTEAWFKTTSTSGGKIIGFGDTADRHQLQLRPADLPGQRRARDLRRLQQRHVHRDDAGHLQRRQLAPGGRVAVARRAWRSTSTASASARDTGTDQSARPTPATGGSAATTSPAGRHSPPATSSPATSTRSRSTRPRSEPRRRSSSTTSTAAAA